jgi:ATP-binding cassette subfamily B protein
VVALHFGQAAIASAYTYLSIKIGLRGLTRVRNEVFSWLLRLSLRFHQGAQAGDVIQRAAWDTYSIQTLFQQGLIAFLGAMISLVFMVGVMWRLNVTLTWVALGTVPFLLLTMRFFSARMSARSQAAQQADSRVTSLVQQGIAALPLTQSYTREAHEVGRFHAQTLTAQEQRLAQHGWEVWYLLAIAAVFGLGTAAISWLGAQEVLAGRLSIGQLLIFLAYLSQLYEPLNQLSHVGSTINGAGAGARRVFEILDTPEEVKDAPGARGIERSTSNIQHPTSNDGGPLIIRGAITFENVTFGYQKEREILHGVSFTLAPGESAALIGPSGVGKTTLLNLLPRFFDPTGGAVKLDGVDLRELRLHDLRTQIAVVLQEPILLPTTILENIAYGRPGATRTEIEAAARAANADGFIRQLPQQYDTVVGDGAARLSVGEKQRLNLARAFLKDAPILLLDEPTSALDAESEALVAASLRDLMRGRTTLMVAHRLATLRQVDQILVLEEGRLMEAGRPAELRQRGGYYARISGGQTTPG